MRSPLLICLLLRLTLCAAAMAPAYVQSQPSQVGLGPDALPAVSEVPLAAPLQPGLGLRGGLGYGLTESVLKEDETHHRAQLDLAASWAALRWFGVAVRLSGRYDVQAGGTDSGEHGVITEAHVRARALLPLQGALRAGAELALWLPGADTLGDSPRALSGDLQLFASYLPADSPLALGLALGLRVDRSKFSGGNPNQYSATDRLTLGVSDSPLAARMGFAGSYRIGSFAVIAEWSWKMYLDYPGQSPMWILAGARFHPSARWQLEALLGYSPSRRPSLALEEPLTRIEPRLSAGISATLVFPWDDAPITRAPVAPAPKPAPPIAASARVTGRVTTPTGVHMAGARVTLEAGEHTHSTDTDAQGYFTFTDLPAGTYRMRVSAKGWSIPDRTLEVAAGAQAPIELTLKRELPRGQIRGTVRSFDGTPLEATVLIPALEIERSTDEAGGFEIDVPPGVYDVLVRVPGFAEQKRKARVELNSVAILIMELLPKSAASK